MHRKRNRRRENNIRNEIYIGFCNKKIARRLELCYNPYIIDCGFSQLLKGDTEQ